MAKQAMSSVTRRRFPNALLHGLDIEYGLLRVHSADSLPQGVDQQRGIAHGAHDKLDVIDKGSLGHGKKCFRFHLARQPTVPHIVHNAHDGEGFQMALRIRKGSEPFAKRIASKEPVGEGAVDDGNK
jgi:hypothetical protein